MAVKTTFLRFYIPVAREAFYGFFSAKDLLGKIVASITSLVTAATALNKEIGAHWAAHWHGISRWWALLPVGTLLLWRLLVSNYKHFESERLARLEAESRVAELVSARYLKHEWGKLESKFIDHGGGLNATMQAMCTRGKSSGKTWWKLFYGASEGSREPLNKH